MSSGFLPRAGSMPSLINRRDSSDSSAGGFAPSFAAGKTYSSDDVYGQGLPSSSGFSPARAHAGITPSGLLSNLTPAEKASTGHQRGASEIVKSPAREPTQSVQSIYGDPRGRVPPGTPSFPQPLPRLPDSSPIWTGSPNPSRRFRNSIAESIPEMDERANPDEASPYSMAHKPEEHQTTEDGCATPGGVKLPRKEQHASGDELAELSLSVANLGFVPRQAIGSGLSVQTQGVAAAYGPGPALSSQSDTLTSSDEVPDSDDTTSRQRARELAEFIRSGGLDDPSRPGSSAATSYGHPYPHSLLSMPHVQRGAQQFSFGTRVQPESIAHENSIDPVVKDLIQRIQQGAADMAFLNKHLPFWNAAINSYPTGRPGVVRIADIPYCTTRPEIVAFFGRNARFLTQPRGSPFYAIHIMMERGSAKSMDCFVEFEDEREASEAARRATRQVPNSGKKPRVGERIVSVSVSSETEFMQALFPRAKCVEWQGEHPLVKQPSATKEPYTHGFKGYISREEMHMVAKFATTPNRSRFAGKHIQRTYESMITLINKYPWWVTQTYTIEERDSIYNTTREQVAELAATICSGRGTHELTPQLLEELLYSALRCPGFSESQRFELVQCARGVVGRPCHVTPFGASVPFQALQRRHDVSEQVMQVYMSYLQQAAFVCLGPQGQARIGNWSDPFCCVRLLLGVAPGSLSVHNAALHEWSTLQMLLEVIAGHRGPQEFRAPQPPQFGSHMHHEG